GMSEDSDYTSDINAPIHLYNSPHHNVSVHQIDARFPHIEEYHDRSQLPDPMYYDYQREPEMYDEYGEDYYSEYPDRMYGDYDPEYDRYERDYSDREYPDQEFPGRDYTDYADPRDYPEGTDLRDFPEGTDPRDFPEGIDPRDFPEGTDPRDFPEGSDPRDFPEDRYDNDYPEDYPREGYPRDGDYRPEEDYYSDRDYPSPPRRRDDFSDSPRHSLYNSPKHSFQEQFLDSPRTGRRSSRRNSRQEDYLYDSPRGSRTSSPLPHRGEFLDSPRGSRHSSPRSFHRDDYGLLREGSLQSDIDLEPINFRKIGPGSSSGTVGSRQSLLAVEGGHLGSGHSLPTDSPKSSRLGSSLDMSRQSTIEDMRLDPPDLDDLDDDDYLPEDTQPSPAKVRWISAFNKVRMHLHE
ncbi:uncharacterized protein LOC102802661, partial [Saccoglossus kowalevskii]|uniref:Uncharacterized protein n=1 Tax=Saccoglossus kowalevskii TaxID=10224 RepID=A0ABM0MBB1_SACKO